MIGWLVAWLMVTVVFQFISDINGSWLINVNYICIILHNGWCLRDDG